ncbi:pyridoxamine 5'-phosphate oxidase family protein [Labrys wisconsinensis]|uniref:Pyridoxine 5'-phosphate oxidase superfamily flavin-nucleotide-binding protein n=1 Tax=Labrys wisconsinensis TaxID=425677 RepID=A0ABU0J8Y7_9HYPH|nr:pyridoxamine 5'-phosphate oxidase family protein [Labrys wisconsinensis]MDQ0469622.1 putative pyridoxine 5'-phosphate oxidase superfamily flavin-nucleotide-binding protein [Labrys wisconsinensis]
MSDLYGPSHRRLQDEHDTTRLADRLEALAHVEIPPDERAFIESRPMVFLSTVDHRGRPTVSYKGGAPGFVRVLDDNRLVFPSYDGNGMFLSLGNIAANPEIGMLFIDFERPRRLRLQGRAALLRDDPLLASYPGARMLVRVDPEQVFVNCGRYIHRSAGSRLSPHIPDAGGCQPFPAWKRIDIFGDVLPAADSRRVAEAGGPITVADYPGEDDPPG